MSGLFPKFASLAMHEKCTPGKMFPLFPAFLAQIEKLINRNELIPSSIYLMLR